MATRKTQTPKALPLNTAILNAVPVILPEYAHVTFVLVGCGGNGSWMAGVIARVLSLLPQVGKTGNALFYDPDVVERENIPRQLFFEPEIGLNKAHVLAARYGLQMGVDITSFDKPFEWSYHNAGSIGNHRSLVILVGCVDGPAGREAMSQTLGHPTYQQHRYWWLDLGNHRDSGQVVLGNTSELNDLKDSFSLKTYCRLLPSAALVHPELLEAQVPDPAPTPAPDGLRGCASILYGNPQSYSINQIMSAIGSDYLHRLLFGELNKWATYFDLRTGSGRSLYTAPEAIARAVGRPKLYDPPAQRQRRQTKA